MSFIFCSQLSDVLKCKEACIHFAKKHKQFKLLLEKWSIIEEIVSTLQIMYDATIMLQNPTFGLSDFYGCWLVSCAKLSELVESQNRQTNLAECMSNSLIARKPQLLENVSMITAVFLDRRFSSELSESEVELAKMSLVRLWKRVQQFKSNQASNEVGDDNPKSYNQYLDKYFNDKGVSCAKSRIALQGLGSANGAMTECELLQMLEKFEKEAVKEDRLPSSTNIIEFWESMKVEFPELFVLACIVYAIPPTQCDIERNFSALSFIFNNKRYKLLQCILEAIMLIRLNPDLFARVCAADLNLLDGK